MHVDANVPGVVNAVEADRRRAIATLVAAFTGDPFIRWMFPDANQYLTWFPEVLHHFGGGAFDHGSAHRSTDGHGVALWLPPGTSPDGEALGAVTHEAVAPRLLGEVLGVFEQVGQAHPREPHWYLPAIGVDPHAHGRGLGSALLAHSLTIVDEQHMAAYLESTNPRNVPLYERFGFSVIGEISVGSSPAMTPMLRPAR